MVLEIEYYVSELYTLFGNSLFCSLKTTHIFLPKGIY